MRAFREGGLVPARLDSRIHLGAHRPDFPFAIEIRHGRPDPFDYCIRARTADDAASVVARMRNLGRGATILEVDA